MSNRSFVVDYEVDGALSNSGLLLQSDQSLSHKPSICHAPRRTIVDPATLWRADEYLQVLMRTSPS
jgi:hypothetical protein